MGGEGSLTFWVDGRGPGHLLGSGGGREEVQHVLRVNLKRQLFGCRQQRRGKLTWQRGDLGI